MPHELLPTVPHSESVERKEMVINKRKNSDSRQHGTAGFKATGTKSLMLSRDNMHFNCQKRYLVCSWACLSLLPLSYIRSRSHRAIFI